VERRAGRFWPRNAAAGQITELPSVLDEITLTWEALRSEALPRGASRELIARVAEERWT